VEARTDLDSERPDIIGYGTSAANAARRPVEGRQNSVTRRLDFVASKTRKITPDRGTMVVKEVTPAAIAKFGGANSRAILTP